LAKNCLFLLPLSYSAPSLPTFPLEFRAEVKETTVMGLSCYSALHSKLCCRAVKIEAHRPTMCGPSRLTGWSIADHQGGCDPPVYMLKKALPIRMTLNDLECPIHLKVRFTDGTFDVRLLRVLDSTIRTGIARGSGGGVGWRA